MRLLLVLAAFLFFGSCGFAQESFDVASIRLSRGAVKFERDGEMTVSQGTLRMRDVTLITCIKWAYHVQRAQIVEPEGIDQQHYDIVAKAEGEATTEQMRVMLRGLLAERFGLKLHPGTKDVNAYAVTVAPQGLKKMKPSASQDGEAWHQNSAMGMVARQWTMQDFVTYVSDPLGTPLVDETHLPGKYDFEIDFHSYVDQPAEIHADPQAVLKATFEGELGLKLVRKRVTIDTLVIDHVAAPTAN
jgi:uncharacterized protein (TIGR03435 family)